VSPGGTYAQRAVPAYGRRRVASSYSAFIRILCPEAATDDQGVHHRDGHAGSTQSEDATVIKFQLPRAVDPEPALTRLRVVLRPSSSAGSVTAVCDAHGDGRLVLVDVDVQRARLVLMCVGVRGGDVLH
jgi:hypothetical protein